MHKDGEVSFAVNCADTRFGFHVRVVGSCQALGSWCPQSGLPLKTGPTEFPTWTSSGLTRLPQEEVIEYKYVICDNDGNPVRWEERPNRTIHLATLVGRGVVPANGRISVVEAFNAPDEADELRFRSPAELPLLAEDSPREPPPVAAEEEEAPAMAQEDGGSLSAPVEAQRPTSPFLPVRNIPFPLPQHLQQLMSSPCSWAATRRLILQTFALEPTSFSIHQAAGRMRRAQALEAGTCEGLRLVVRKKVPRGPREAGELGAQLKEEPQDPWEQRGEAERTERAPREEELREDPNCLAAAPTGSASQRSEEATAAGEGTEGSRIEAGPQEVAKTAPSPSELSEHATSPAALSQLGEELPEAPRTAPCTSERTATAKRTEFSETGEKPEEAPQEVPRLSASSGESGEGTFPQGKTPEAAERFVLRKKVPRRPVGADGNPLTGLPFLLPGAVDAHTKPPRRSALQTAAPTPPFLCFHGLRPALPAEQSKQLLLEGPHKSPRRGAARFADQPKHWLGA